MTHLEYETGFMHVYDNCD